MKQITKLEVIYIPSIIGGIVCGIAVCTAIHVSLWVLFLLIPGITIIYLSLTGQFNDIEENGKGE